jgi:hypothetical protein
MYCCNRRADRHIQAIVGATVAATVDATFAPIYTIPVNQNNPRLYK